MKTYFWVAENRDGLLKSGVVSGVSAFYAYTQASKIATKWSDDQFVIVKLEVIE